MLNWHCSMQPGMSLHDALRQVCAQSKPASYLEIGVDGGESLRTVLSVSSPTRIVLCDIWNREYCKHGFSNHDHVLPILNGKEALFLDGDSRETVPTLKESFDVITVDGDHSETGATDDLENTWPLLNVGGFLVFDDVNHPAYPHMGRVIARFLNQHRDAEVVAERNYQKANTIVFRKAEKPMMRLELGTGNKPTPGYTHHDRWLHSPHIDTAFDLESMPWPLESESIDEVLALDVFEHLRVEVQAWLDECWRVLEPNGLLEFRLPAWDNPYSYCDPTHRRVFHNESFHYWCPDAPGTIFENFGRYYFGEGYCKWWTLESVKRDPITSPYSDLRWRLRKLTGRGADGK